MNPVLLRDGSPQQVAEATDKMIGENLPGGRYIFNTGEGVMRNSVPANVAAMLDTAKKLASNTDDRAEIPLPVDVVVASEFSADALAQTFH